MRQGSALLALALFVVGPWLHGCIRFLEIRATTLEDESSPYPMHWPISRLDVATPATPDLRPDVARPDSVSPKPDLATPDVGTPDLATLDSVGPKPDVAKPDVAKPDAAKPDAAKPDAAKPDVAKPDVAKPDAAKPDAAKPDSVGPKLDKSCSQAVLHVSALADDGEITEYNALLPDGESGDILWTGYWSVGSTWGYFRFALAQAIPAGAKISGATLALWGEAVDSWSSSTHALEIWAESSADAAVVTSATDEPLIAGGRPVTSTPVRWPGSGGLSWLVGGYNTSPSLAAPFQELVNTKGTLAAGSHVQLWLRGAQAVTGEVATPDYKRPGYVAHPATLTIGWCL